MSQKKMKRKAGCLHKDASMIQQFNEISDICLLCQGRFIGRTFWKRDAEKAVERKMHELSQVYREKEKRNMRLADKCAVLVLLTFFFMLGERNLGRRCSCGSVLDWRERLG